MIACPSSFCLCLLLAFAFVLASADEKDCYNAYCNAWSDLKSAFCGGENCTTEEHSEACKTYWNAHGGVNHWRGNNPVACACNKTCIEDRSSHDNAVYDVETAATHHVWICRTGKGICGAGRTCRSENNCNATEADPYQLDSSNTNGGDCSAGHKQIATIAECVAASKAVCVSGVIPGISEINKLFCADDIQWETRMFATFNSSSCPAGCAAYESKRCGSAPGSIHTWGAAANARWRFAFNSHLIGQPRAFARPICVAAADPATATTSTPAVAVQTTTTTAADDVPTSTLATQTTTVTMTTTTMTPQVSTSTSTSTSASTEKATATASTSAASTTSSPTETRVSPTSTSPATPNPDADVDSGDQADRLLLVLGICGVGVLVLLGLAASCTYRRRKRSFARTAKVAPRLEQQQKKRLSWK